MVLQGISAASRAFGESLVKALLQASGTAGYANALVEGTKKYRFMPALTRISKICAARVENVSRAGACTRPKVECSQLEIHSRSLAKAHIREERQGRLEPTYSPET